MTDGVTRLRLAASDNESCNLRRPERITPARSGYAGSPGSGRASIAAAYICIAASDKPTITGASPSLSSDTATRFIRRLVLVTNTRQWEHGRANGNPVRRRFQPLLYTLLEDSLLIAKATR